MNGVYPPPPADDAPPGEFVVHWLGAARAAVVAAEIEGLFVMVADAIEARGPACWASGRCCNFKATGHRLYVTGLEAAFTLARAGWPGDERLGAAVESGGCPFQVSNLCGVHRDKPLGCRLYFCDETAQQWQHDLYQRLHEGLKGVHVRHGVAYRYGEWRQLLAMFSSARLPVWRG